VQTFYRPIDIHSFSKRKKKPPGKKHFPGDFFGKRTQFVSCVFELPLPLPKKTPKNALKNKLRAGADVRRFPVLFCLPPLGLVLRTPWTLSITEPQKWCFFGIQLKKKQSHALQSTSRFSARREASESAKQNRFG
jgi:hypothetical protein